MRSQLDKLRAHPRVEIVDDERDIGNGVIVTLRQGWTFERGVDNRVRGEDTLAVMLATVRAAYPFAGPFES